GRACGASAIRFRLAKIDSGALLDHIAPASGLIAVARPPKAFRPRTAHCPHAGRWHLAMPSSRRAWRLGMRYQIAPLFCRPWTLNGITPRLIESHYENNYGGAFVRLNAISEELEALDPATAPAHVIRRLKQDEAAEVNSLALDELYFASLGADGRGMPDDMSN